MEVEEAIKFAKAYALGIRDATDEHLEWVDIWYGLDEYDINIDGFKQHCDPENEKQLRIMVYSVSHFEPMFVCFTEKGK